MTWRRMGARRPPAIVLWAVVWLLTGFVVEEARGERPTEADIEEMLPRTATSSDFRMPYYKWASGSSIGAVVVTGGQSGACVDIAIAKLKRQVGLVKELVPELRNLEEPVVLSWLPSDPARSTLMIGLEMENDKIQAAMADYARRSRPHADLRSFPLHMRQLSTEDAFAIDQGKIVHAFGWTTYRGGLSQLPEEVCRQSDWDKGILFSLLGAGNFSVIGTRRWLRGVPEQEAGRWRDYANRLFLRALYSCPTDLAASDCVKVRLKALVNDRALGPKD